MTGREKILAAMVWRSQAMTDGRKIITAWPSQTVAPARRPAKPSTELSDTLGLARRGTGQESYLNALVVTDTPMQAEHPFGPLTEGRACTMGAGCCRILMRWAGRCPPGAGKPV